ncbi:MAG: mechanosensitive ion channel family protein [Silicimonas sp.]|nr:mechanosensitive ion channel family protein [Silicimonas sp.]
MIKRSLFLVTFAASLLLWLGVAVAEEAFFETEALNTGLGVAPERVDRSTPRATVETLFRLGALGDWEAAAHVLDLSALPPGLQAEQGAELARKLKSVLDRKIIIDWSQIVDRPDALDARASSRAATSGMARKSLRLWEFDLGPVPSSIRINRIAADGGEPVWVFSERTVENILPLYAEFGPTRFEQWLPESLRKDAFWGLMWWEFIGLPLLITAAVAVGLAVRSGVRAVRRKATARLSKKIIQAASTPLIVAAITTVIWWGAANLFVFSGRINVLVSPLVAVGFVTALLMLILNTLEQVLDALVGFEDIDLTTRQEAQNREMATKVAALRRVLALAIFLIGAGIVFSTANIFEWLGLSILASAGAITLILGFAAQKVLANIMASLQISLNQSAKVGDRVVFKDHLCHVERINFTYVQLRDWDGTRLVVPVEEFANETFENWTLKEPEMLRILKFKLLPDVDLEALREAHREVIGSLDPEELDDTQKAKVVVTGQDVFGIDVWFYVPCADPNTSWDVACQAREALVDHMNRIARQTKTPIFPEATPAEAA